MLRPQGWISELPGVVFGALGSILGSLFDHLGSFWSSLGPGRPKIVIPSPIATHFRGFWADFGVIWEPFGMPKVRKSDPESLPKINRFFDIEISWFLMIFGLYLMLKTSKKHWFFNGFVQFVFWPKVGPREQNNPVFGPQNDPESELWSTISASKIDKKSGSKKRGSKIEKSIPQGAGVPILGTPGCRTRQVHQRHLSRIYIYIYIYI